MDEDWSKLGIRLAERTSEEALIKTVAGQLGSWDWRTVDSSAEYLKYSPEKVQKGVLDLLIEKLSDKDWKVRDSAAGALGHIAAKSMDVSIAIPELIKTLRDEVGQVKDDTVWALENAVSGYKTKKELLQFLRKIRGSAEAKQLSMRIYKIWMKKQNEKIELNVDKNMRKPQEKRSKYRIKKMLN